MMSAALLAMALAMQGSARTADDLRTGLEDGRLCGLDARDNPRLLAEVRAMPRVEPFGEQGDYVQLMDRNNGLIWTFTLPGKLAYPAISCSEFGPRNGKLALRQSMTCAAPDPEECTLFFELNRQRNDDVLRILAEDDPQPGT